MKLKGEKTILRPITLKDAPRFVKWLSDPEVNKYTTRKSISLKEENKWIKSLSRLKKTEYHFAIDTIEGAHIGSEELFLDVMDKTARLGIMIGDKNYWDKGYGTDAVVILLIFAFNKLNLYKVYLSVFAYNMRAIKLYEKLGFTVEGVRREDIFYEGKRYDLIEMGLLKSEWKK